MYSSEQELVDQFVIRVDQNLSPWKISEFNTEFDYSRGRTDIVLVDISGNVIAIEAKLDKWKYAIQQAYRNRCFANLSYVLLPHDVAMHACAYTRELDMRGVGVCSIEGDAITILYEAPADEPLQPWLNEKAIEYAKG